MESWDRLSVDGLLAGFDQHLRRTRGDYPAEPAAACCSRPVADPLPDLRAVATTRSATAAGSS
jgi:hypothetical protein